MPKLFVLIVSLVISLKGVCQDLTPQDYIDKYKQLAISEMQRAGVPAAITLAQGILETQSGNSDLLKASNNHFGIKCKSDWTGPSVSHDDDAPGECFRVYENAEASYRDHSDFLRKGARYAFLFDLDPADYKGWANGLRKAGYATNPQYAKTLINYIEKYNLEQYTLAGMIRGLNGKEYQTVHQDMSPGNDLPFRTTSPENDWITFRLNGVNALKADAGTSLLAIANKFHIRLGKLLKYNDLEKDGILNETQTIFLGEKPSTGELPSVILDQSQSAYQVSQQYGIRLAALCDYNRFGKGDIISSGTVVYLHPYLKDISKKSPSADAAYHVVEPKEGLYGISRRYDVTIEQIKKWNNLPDNNLQTGQKLVIYK